VKLAIASSHGDVTPWRHFTSESVAAFVAMEDGDETDLNPDSSGVRRKLDPVEAVRLLTGSD